MVILILQDTVKLTAMYNDHSLSRININEKNIENSVINKCIPVSKMVVAV